MRTILADSLSQMMVGGELKGLGKVVYTALDTTYVRVMAGQTAGYASYWAGLLRLVGRPEGSADKWNWEPACMADKRGWELAGCVVGEELDLSMHTSEAIPQGMLWDGERGVSVYLAEDEGLPFVWRGRYWPEAVGWVAVSDPRGDTSWMYVWPRGSWPAMDREERKIGKASVGEERAPVPKYWGYVIFLLCVFFLWAEQKFY
jgi:hypothetical protein